MVVSSPSRGDLPRMDSGLIFVSLFSERHFVIMKPSRFFLITAFFGLCATSALALDFPFFRSTDPLAQRDEWGLLTSGPLNSTDFERRYPWRFIYYPISGHELAADRAYVGALQTALRRTGYYVGPIDGVFSPEVEDAIARLQKAHAMRVNGRLTVSVRRALYLP
jgi:Putative peptidoglycan binding domain